MAGEGFVKVDDAFLAELVAHRAATDNGVRHDLDDVLASFGMNRAELERPDMPQLWRDEGDDS